MSYLICVNRWDSWSWRLQVTAIWRERRWSWEERAPPSSWMTLTVSSVLFALDSKDSILLLFSSCCRGELLDTCSLLMLFMSIKFSLLVHQIALKLMWQDLFQRMLLESFWNPYKIFFFFFWVAQYIGSLNNQHGQFSCFLAICAHNWAASQSV